MPLRVDDGREAPVDAVSLTGQVALALAGSPFRMPAAWKSAVAIIRVGERPTATSRGDFAGWLTAQALPGAAHECIRRKVPHGSILVWLEVDVEGLAAARFHVFDLANEIRRAS